MITAVSLPEDFTPVAELVMSVCLLDVLAKVVVEDVVEELIALV